MEGNEIDKLFKSKLSGFEASYNPAGWDAAEAMLGSSNSGKWRLWLLLLLLIVMGSGAMWCCNLTRSATQGAQVNAQTDVLTTGHDRITGARVLQSNEDLDPGEKTLAGHLTDVNTFSSNDSSSDNTNYNSNINTQLHQANTQSSTRSTRNEIAFTHGGDPESKARQADSANGSGTSDLTDNRFTEQSGSDGTGSRGIQELDALYTGGGAQDTGTLAASNDTKETSNGSEDAFVANGSTDAEAERPPFNMDLLTIRMPDPFTVQWDRAGIDEADRNVELYTPTFWQIRVFGGLGSLSRNLITNDSGLSGFVDQRNREEQVKYAWEAGVEGAYEPGRFQFTFGANWLKYSELVNYTAPSTTTYDSTFYDVYTNIETTYYGVDSVFIEAQDTSYWSVTVVGTSDLDTLVVSYSEINATTSREDWSTYNVKSDFQYIELPITVGYVHRLGNWRAGISTGVSASWLISTRGYYLETGQDRVLVRQDIARKWTYHYLLRLHLAYAINDKVNVYVQPVFRMGLNNVLSTDEVDQRYRSYGIRAGVGFSF